MKQTHTRRDKGRAVFLAALMVLSVFAMSVSFAGAAAAQAQGVSLPSDTVNLNDDPAETDITVTADGSYSNYAYAIVNDSNNVVASGDVARDTAANSHTFTSVDVSGLDEGEYTVYAEAGADATAPTEGEDVGDFGDDGATATLSVIAQVTVDNLGAQDDFYQGQQIEVTGFTGGETVELHDGTSADGEPVEYLRANGDGTVTIDTTELDGPYVLADSNGETSGPFWVVEQDISAEFAGDTVAQTNTELTYESENRDDAVDLEISSANHSGEELAEIFDADQTNDDSIVVEGVSPSDSLNADFSDVETGEYDFTVSVVDTTAEADASIEVTEGGEPNAEFDDSVYQQEAGDTAEFTVKLENADSATVTIGEENDNYDAELEVVDGNDDGEVTVEFNTYLAGSGEDGTFSAADDDDSVNVEEENAEFNYDEDERLLPASLNMELLVNDERVDVATLKLSQGSIDSVTSGTAPSDAGLEETDDVVNATTESDEIAEGDNVVFAFEASGVFGAIEEGDFENYFNLVLEQTNDQYDDGEELTSDDYTLVEDSENDRFFVVLTMDEGEMQEGDEFELRLEPETDEDDNIDSLYFIDDEDYKKGSGVIVSTQFSIVERMVEFNGMDKEDVLRVPTSEEATISGETTVAPGSEIYVEIDDSGDSPFLMTDTVEVDEDGTFSTTFDTSEQEVGQEFEATAEVLQLDDDVSTTVDAIFVKGDAGDRHSVTVHVEDADGNAVSGAEISADGETATTDDDGKAVLELAHGDYKISASYDGEDASGKLTVDDETPDEVTLTLGEEDVDLNPDEKKDEDKKDDENKDNNNDNDNDGDDNNNDDDQPGSGADDDQPGFGIIIALIALLAAAGFALRRQ